MSIGQNQLKPFFFLTEDDMRKSLLVLAIGMALTGSAFALTVDDLNSPYEMDISAGSEGLIVTDAGKVINEIRS